jgi:hypothetical protein
MSLIEQPESYSDVLKRVFYVSLAAGIASTVVIAYVSPEAKALLDKGPYSVELGGLNEFKALYVAIPFSIALASRVILLHDQLQKIFCLRAKFELDSVLLPLAQQVGFPMDARRKQWLITNRRSAMYQAFYPYASFMDPMIDKQLVRTAADQWGWFWAALESAFILAVSCAILAILQAWTWVIVFILLCCVLLLGMRTLWKRIRKTALEQVAAIANEGNRASDIRDVFFRVCEKM